MEMMRSSEADAGIGRQRSAIGILEVIAHPRGRDRSTLLRRHASARQPLARALGYIDPLLAAGIHLGLACAGVGGARAIVLSGLGHSIAFLHVGLVRSERWRAKGRRSECQQTADGRNRRIRLLHRFSPWVIDDYFNSLTGRAQLQARRQPPAGGNRGKRGREWTSNPAAPAVWTIEAVYRQGGNRHWMRRAACVDGRIAVWVNRVC